MRRCFPSSMEERIEESLTQMILGGNAPQEQHDQVVDALEEQGAVLEHCQKCNALLDVSGCTPLTETTCPSCGGMIKVLREFHHFVLLSKLGQGGSGTVYRAFDETLERDVALKLLRNQYTRDQAYIDALEREAMITASINHPHVVNVYSTGSKNGYFFIAMEIVSGGSLAQNIDREVQSEEKVLSIGIQVAEGLRAAYVRGLLHRDVKPGNILFADRESVKVADFGLAIPVSHANDDADELWGTPDYIAPEKLLRRGEDLRSDIYSLGCTLFHCLAGAPPVDTTTVMRLLEHEVVQPAPNIQEVAPHISGSTAFVLKRSLEINPDDRYQSYDELIEHLEYARDQRLEATLASAVAPTKQRTQRLEARPKMGFMWGAIAALVVVAASATGYLALHSSQQVATQASARTTKGDPAESAPTAASNGARRTPAPPPAPVLPAGLAGWWKFDDGDGRIAVDSSDGSHTAILHSAPSWTAGKVGGALSFDGNGDCATIDNIDVDASRDFTISAWVQVARFDGWYTIVSRDGDSASGFFLQYGQAIGGKFCFSIGAIADKATSVTKPAPGTWYHLTGVCHASHRETKLYVNGLLEGVQTFNPADARRATGAFAIGRGKYNGRPTDFFPGKIDEVRVFTRALTDSEVRDNFEGKQ